MPFELQAFLDFIWIFIEVVGVAVFLLFFTTVMVNVIRGAFDDCVRGFKFISSRIFKRSNENIL